MKITTALQYSGLIFLTVFSVGIAIIAFVGLILIGSKAVDKIKAGYNKLKWAKFIDRQNSIKYTQDEKRNKIECQCVDCQYYSDNYCTYEGDE